jgi:hypothetical protein
MGLVAKSVPVVARCALISSRVGYFPRTPVLQEISYTKLSAQDEYLAELFTSANGSLFGNFFSWITLFLLLK